MSDDITITIADVRQVTFCVRGTRVWFERYNLDFKQFLKDGLPASVIEGTGDALGKHVVDAARERIANGRR